MALIGAIAIIMALATVLLIILGWSLFEAIIGALIVTGMIMYLATGLRSH